MLFTSDSEVYYDRVASTSVLLESVEAELLDYTEVKSLFISCTSITVILYVILYAKENATRKKLQHYRQISGFPVEEDVYAGKKAW